MNLAELFAGPVNAAADFLSHDAGQQRRAWLDRKDARASDALRYALGPHLYPPVEALGKLAELFAPGQDVADAHRAGTDFGRWEGPLDAAGDAATFGAAVGSMFLPGGVSSYRQGIDELVDAGVNAHKSGRLNIFAGPMAATADHAALRRAEELEGAGTGPDDIWRDTGWLRGPDGKWRFEIDDSKAKLRQTPLEKPMKLGDALDHPELYAAYPSARETGFMRTDELLGGAKGQWTAGGSGALSDGTAFVGSSADDPLAAALHEVQHGVQGVEGFAAGASPGTMRLRPGTPLGDAFLARLRSNPRLLPDQLDALATDFASGDMDRFSETVNRLGVVEPAVAAQRGAMRDPEANKQNYLRQAGEVEARNVEARRTWPAETRRQVSPRVSAPMRGGVRWEDQILNW